mgnify:CR=1 FL=1
MDINSNALRNTLIEAVGHGMGIIAKRIGGHLPDDPEVKENLIQKTVISEQRDHRVDPENEICPKGDEEENQSQLLQRPVTAGKVVGDGKTETEATERGNQGQPDRFY